MKAIAFFVHEDNTSEEPDRKILFPHPDMEEEMNVCLKESFPFFYLISKDGRKMLSSHGYQDPFSKVQVVNQNGELMSSLTGVTLLLRSTGDNIRRCIEVIKAIGGVPLISWEEEREVERWYEGISPQFLKRGMSVFPSSKFGEIWFNQPERVKIHEREGQMFIKGTHKGSLTGLVTSERDIWDIVLHSEIMNLDSDILVSDPLDIIKDAGGNKEYRAFVILGKIANVSRYIDRGIDHEIPKEIISFANAFVDAHRNTLPHSYVVDMALDLSRGPVVIELNTISASGRYRKNKFEDIINILRKNSPL